MVQWSSKYLFKNTVLILKKMLQQLQNFADVTLVRDDFNFISAHKQLKHQSCHILIWLLLKIAIITSSETSVFTLTPLKKGYGSTLGWNGEYFK